MSEFEHCKILLSCCYLLLQVHICADILISRVEDTKRPLCDPLTVHTPVYCEAIIPCRPYPACMCVVSVLNNI